MNNFVAKFVVRSVAKKDASLTETLANFMWPRQESNLYLELRKLLYYPLYYEASQAANVINNT